MKPKLNIFSTEELKFFFINLDDIFDISIKSFEDIEKFYDQKNLSVVFLENESKISEKIIKQIYENKNFIFVCSDFSVFQKHSLNQENALVSPISISIPSVISAHIFSAITGAFMF